MLEILLNALPYIVTGLTAFFGSTILLFKQNKHHAELENESFEGGEWKKLYEEQKERAGYWETRAEDRQNRLDERDEYWLNKVGGLEGEIATFHEEKISLLKQVSDKDMCIEKLDRMKCEVRGCTNRKPPSESMM